MTVDQSDPDIVLELRPWFGKAWHYPLCAVSTLIAEIAEIKAFMPWQVDMMRNAGWIVEVRQNETKRPHRHHP